MGLRQAQPFYGHGVETDIRQVDEVQTVMSAGVCWQHHVVLHVFIDVYTSGNGCNTTKHVSSHVGLTGVSKCIGTLQIGS